MNPIVSVIIPTYKRPANLSRTILSVLKQTYTPIEIIVVDDNGLDTFWQKETEKELKDFIEKNKIKYLIHPTNLNGSAARNTGFKHCKGKYICFLDDDDYFLPNKIEMQVRRLKDTHQKIGATYCNSIIIAKDKVTNKIKHIKTHNNKEGDLCLEYLTNICRFNTSTILFKRECIESLNGFDESFTRHQDYELMTRFFMRYTIVCTSEIPLLCYDTTQTRTYTYSGEKDYYIKEKFLSTFFTFFQERKIQQKVSHHFWYQCLYNSVLNKNFKYAYKAFKQIDRLTMKEYLSLIRNFVIGITRL